MSIEYIKYYVTRKVIGKWFEMNDNKLSLEIALNINVPPP